MTEPLIIGADPSFSGFALSDGTEHVVFAAPKALDGEERATATRRRCIALVATIEAWLSPRLAEAAREGREVHVYIEAAMLSAGRKRADGKVSAGAGHLYELGYLMAKLDHRLRQLGVRVIVEVASATLRKFIGLPGNAAKIEVPVRVLRRFGVEFERDRGADMAFAFVLQRYGLAVTRGEHVHVPTLARGQKKGRAA